MEKSLISKGLVTIIMTKTELSWVSPGVRVRVFGIRLNDL